MRNDYQVKSLMLKNLTVVCSLFLLTCFSISVFAQENDQKIINKVPKHLPIKVEIIKEDNQSRLSEIKIKVTNTGEKPIYYLKLMIITSDDSVKHNGLNIGLSSPSYGNSKFIDFNKLAEESDISLKKNEVFVFGIEERDVNSFNSLLNDYNLPSDPKFTLEFQVLSYGDKTGFLGFTGVPIPNPKPKSRLINFNSKGFFLTFRR